jgi:hypothetical protein
MASMDAVLVVSRTPAITMLLARWAYAVTSPRPIPRVCQMSTLLCCLRGAPLLAPVMR